MPIAMPGPNDNDPRDKIYRDLVEALPEESKTVHVVQSLAMLLSAILIEQGRDKEKRIKATKMICNKIIEAVQLVPDHNHDYITESKTRH